MRKLILLLNLLLPLMALSQSVGIGTTTPQSSAILDVNSANKGLLLPRNADPAANVASPAAGLVLYNSNTNEPNYYNGSQWQSMVNLPAQFQRSITFPGTLYNASPSTVDFAWQVPAGVNTVWIELWGAGDAGGEIPATSTSELSNLGGNGGDAGSYLSIVLPVTAGSSISVSAGKGGTDTNPSGGSSSITYGTARYLVSQASTGFSYTVSNVSTTPVPHVVAFVAGEAGHTNTQSFQQAGSTNFRRVITGGKGGDAFMGGRGGTGKLVAYDMATGSPYPTSLFSANGKPGAAPGGGGGAGFGVAGSGGPGLVIIHY